jgi:anti-sigma B factor antagonist
VQSYLSVRVDDRGDSVVLHLDGELDLASSVQVEQALAQAREARPRLIVIDARNLEFIDMAGLRVLVAAHERARREQVRLVLTHVGQPVRRVLELARATDILPIAEGEQ